MSLKPLSRTKTTKSTGEHTLPKIAMIDVAFSPVDQAQKRTIKSITDKLNSLASSQPDYDSGYFKVSNASIYTKTHNIGSIPSKVSIFFSRKEEPIIQRDSIYPILPVIVSNVGLTLQYTDKNTMVLTTGSSYVYAAYTTGYLRILAWR